MSLFPFPKLSRCWLLLALLGSGCVNQWTTRFPRFGWDSSERERRAAQVYDPFPDSKMGPYVGFRPLEFQQQRSEAQQAKDNYFAGTIAPRLSAPQGQPTPTPTPGPQPQLQPQPVLPAPTSYYPGQPGMVVHPPQGIVTGPPPGMVVMPQQGGVVPASGYYPASPPF